MVDFNANTIVADIDVDDPWFKVDASEERVPLPGEKRFPSDDNKLSRKQIAQIVRGSIALGMGDLPLGEAADILRDQQHANIRGSQRDFSIIDYLNEQARKPNVNEPLTGPQGDLVATTMAALEGTKDHWDAETQRRINAMPEARRQKWSGLFEDVETRGQLDVLLKKFSAIVGDIAERNAKRNRTTVTEAADAVDIGEVGDVNTDDPELDDEGNPVDPNKAF